MPNKSQQVRTDSGNFPAVNKGKLAAPGPGLESAHNLTVAVCAVTSRGHLRNRNLPLTGFPASIAANTSLFLDVFIIQQWSDRVVAPHLYYGETIGKNDVVDM